MAKAEVCKTSIRRFESARRLQPRLVLLPAWLCAVPATALMSYWEAGQRLAIPFTGLSGCYRPCSAR